MEHFLRIPQTSLTTRIYLSIYLSITTVRLPRDDSLTIVGSIREREGGNRAEHDEYRFEKLCQKALLINTEHHRHRLHDGLYTLLDDFIDDGAHHRHQFEFCLFLWRLLPH